MFLQERLQEPLPADAERFGATRVGGRVGVGVVVAGQQHEVRLQFGVDVAAGSWPCTPAAIRPSACRSATRSSTRAVSPSRLRLPTVQPLGSRRPRQRPLAGPGARASSSILENDTSQIHLREIIHRGKGPDLLRNRSGDELVHGNAVAQCTFFHGELYRETPWTETGIPSRKSARHDLVINPPIKHHQPVLLADKDKPWELNRISAARGAHESQTSVLCAPKEPQQTSPGQSGAALAAEHRPGWGWHRRRGAHEAQTSVFCAPKGPQQISPGQSGAALAAEHRPGWGWHHRARGSRSANVGVLCPEGAATDQPRAERSSVSCGGPPWVGMASSAEALNGRNSTTSDRPRLFRPFRADGLI